MSTPATTQPRAWSECPTCDGRGQVALHPGARCIVRWASREEHDLIAQCEICSAHFTALDAAYLAGAEEAVHLCDLEMARWEPPAGKVYAALSNVVAAIRSLPLEPPR